jgi:3-oxoacyl-[acyl-carrier protein] reductase
MSVHRCGQRTNRARHAAQRGNEAMDDRVAVVTGGSRGIGKAIAIALARAGYRVAVCARDAAQLDLAAQEIERAARQAGAPADVPVVAPVPLDVTRRDAAERLIAETCRALGDPDVVVNNVGGSRRKPFDATTDADWDELLELNVLSGLRIARAAIPAMKQRRRGVIIFIASIWGREAGHADMSLYATTKAAVVAAAKMMAIDLAPFGIRVNSIAPGSIRFEGGSWDRRAREDPAGIRDFVDRNMPLGRFGTVDEVAALAAFLASDAASLITGACIPADGAQGRSII